VKGGRYGGTALFYAAMNGHLEVMKVLVQAGAGVDVARDTGMPPLHTAR